MRRRIELWLPILIMLGVAPFSGWLDVSLTRLFYIDWQEFIPAEFFRFLYVWSPKIVMVGVFFLVVGFCWSWITGWRKEWRVSALYLILVVVLGCGVAINLTIKEIWGRPRPVQTVEFGGVKEFRPFYMPDFYPEGDPSKSFPSGHASGGFAFFGFYFLGRRLGVTSLMWFGLVGGLGFGALLGVTRMAQGGHYLTDIMGSAVVMWYVAMVVDRVMYRERG